MDKTVIFAVAGSGKTTKLISELDLKKRFLVVTYTDDNEENIKAKIIKRFGYIPKNVVVFSYFTFLHSFCYRPFLALEMKTKGLFWEDPPVWTSRQIKHNNRKHFIDISMRVYHNRLAKFLETENVMPDVIARIEKYFDVLFVDEVQDFGGHDFNFVTSIAKSKISLLMVGDFFQHTYDTSRDGQINGTLHNDYIEYKKRFKKFGITVDVDSLIKSHRCSATVCNYIRENIGIEIQSHTGRVTEVKWVLDQDTADKLYLCQKTVKLFYKEHHKYSCYSRNWGSCKGQDHYEDVCVVVNKGTFAHYEAGSLLDLKPLTKNKFYVACSRAKNNLYFVSDAMYRKYKEETVHKSGKGT